MRSSNPVLSERVFRNFESYGDTTVMTAHGTAIKTIIALCLAMLTAGMTWFKFQQAGGLAAGGAEVIMPYLWGGVIVGLITAVVTTFKPDWAAFTTPVYALAEGCVLGGLSAIVASQFPDVPIVFQACCLTFGTMFVMLVGYQTGIINVTDKFRAGVMAATGGIALLYIASMVLRMFGMPIQFIHSAGGLGIAFSVFVVVIAALNLVLDFDMIDRMVRSRAPKYMEWYGAFALLVTLVWLYIEILRLLSKLNRRR
jgi:uncharacterized YccA/Bax inhibitor family protein